MSRLQPHGDPFAGEIRLFAGLQAPYGWLLCEGQELGVHTGYDELYDAIGTRYGGQPGEWFKLPDLRGRAPVCEGPRHPAASSGGSEHVTLRPVEMPAHRHALSGTDADATSTEPAGKLLAALAGSGDASAYAPPSDPPRRLHQGAIDWAGGNAPHDNLQPYCALSFIIAVDGHSPREPEPHPEGEAQPLLGEVRMWALGYAPNHYVPCDGRALPASQHRALWQVIGTRFGGEGASFRVPEMRARVPLGAGAGPGLTPRPLGQYGGAREVKLGVEQLPVHNHRLVATGDPGVATQPSGNALASGVNARMYHPYDRAPAKLGPGSIGAAGGGKAHPNMAPYLPISMSIAIEGVWPYSDQAA